MIESPTIKIKMQCDAYFSQLSIKTGNKNFYFDLGLEGPYKNFIVQTILCVQVT